MIVLPLRAIDYSSLASLATFALLAAGLAWTALQVRLRSAWFGALLFGMAALIHGWVLLAGYFPGLVQFPLGSSGEPHVSRMLLSWAITWLPPLFGAVATIFALHGLCRQPTHTRGTPP